MPLFDEGGNTGAHYQTAWQALTGLFDKKRRGTPTPHNDDEDDPKQTNPDTDPSKRPDKK